MGKEPREPIDHKEGTQAKKCAQGKLVLGREGPAKRCYGASEAATVRTLGEGSTPAEGVEKRDGGEADDAAQKRAKQDGEECSAHAEKGADHGHHFDVTHAHAIALADEFVESSGAPEQQAAKGCAEQRVDQAGYERRNVMVMNGYVGDAVWRNARCERESQAEAEPVDRVGKQAHAKIGDDQNQE